MSREAQLPTSPNFQGIFMEYARNQDGDLQAFLQRILESMEPDE